MEEEKMEDKKIDMTAYPEGRQAAVDCFDYLPEGMQREFALLGMIGWLFTN